MMNNDKIKGIYIHIPFCNNICFYCDFCKVYYENDLADKYINQLKKEINSYSINYEEIESIYIGGGTPSSLSFEQLEELFKTINVNHFKNLKEFTIEVNPESMDINKIELFKKNNVNRVSIGVQTFNDNILRSINRQHNEKMVVELVSELKDNGITNISVDLMYGFNNQTIKDIEYDLEMIKKLDIKHLSIYSLILENSTVFSKSNYKVNENEYEMSEFIDNYLVNILDFEHYEVSNYAKNKMYSNHNLLYWNNEKYFGFGLGAAGYLNDYRYYNTKSITNYIKGEYNIIYEYYDNKFDLLKDEIMLKFRLFNGINLDVINKKYSLDFTKYFENVIIININNIYIEDNKLYFTKRGKNFLNDIIIDFIDSIKED